MGKVLLKFKKISHLSYGISLISNLLECWLRYFIDIEFIGVLVTVFH